MTRRRWVSEQAYADLVALCQFLPGPASSQVGMAIGLHRAGYAGLAAAWMAFTLPSAVLLVGFAYGADALGADADADGFRGSGPRRSPSSRTPSSARHAASLPAGNARRSPSWA